MTKHQLKLRSDLHLARKFWHVSGVMAIFVVYLNLNQITALQAITIFALFAVAIDLIRQQVPALNQMVLQVMHPFMRASERHGLAGTTYLLLGVFFIILLFPRKIVSLSLLFLALGDPIASYFGIRFGKDKLVGNKSVQGSMAAFFTCGIVFAIYCLATNTMTDRLLIVSILAGFIGALAELAPVGKLDDNFTIPIISASLLSVLFYVFGGF